MPAIQFGLSSYERARGDLPALPVINMVAEEGPTEGKVILQSRPALLDREADMGTGPVDTLFKRDLVLGGALFGVSGGELYEETTSLGAIDGSGPFSIDGYKEFLFTAGGGSLWGYDGTTLAAVAMPNGENVVKVFVGASRAIAIVEGTDEYYFSDPLETDIDALDFAASESKVDRLLDGLFIDDTAVLFGAETVEFHPNTNDPDLPFQPLEGRVFEKGIKATGCATGIGPTFAWVTNQNQVCLGDETTIISNEGLEEKIAVSTSCRLFTFLISGTEFLCLRIDNETHVWSWRSKRWSEFTTYGADNWAAQTFAGGVFGSAIDGKTMAWGGGHVDLGLTLERRFRGGFPLNSGGFRVDNVQLRCNTGQTPFLEGDYADPPVEMRLSRNAGQTWSNWKRTTLGIQGNYRKRVQWRSCGMASQPGFLTEFRVTAPIDWRVSDVLLNEGTGGR